MELIDKVLEKANIFNEFVDVGRVWVAKSGIDAVIFIEMLDGETKSINIDIPSVLPPELTDPTTSFFKYNFENIATYVLLAHVTKLFNIDNESKMNMLDEVFRLVVRMQYLDLKSLLLSERFLVELTNILNKNFGKTFSKTVIGGLGSSKTVIGGLGSDFHDNIDDMNDRLREFKKFMDELEEDIHNISIWPGLEIEPKIINSERTKSHDCIRLLDAFMYLKMVYMERIKLINCFL